MNAGVMSKLAASLKYIYIYIQLNRHWYLTPKLADWEYDINLKTYSLIKAAHYELFCPRKGAAQFVLMLES